MAAFDPVLLPLVEMEFVADARNEWVALSVHVDPAGADASLRAAFGHGELLAAIAPLDCILFVSSPSVLTPELLVLLPPARLVLAIAAAALAETGAIARIAALRELGYRILVDAPAPAGSAVVPGVRGTSADCRAAAPAPVFGGPHLARRVDTGLRFAECVQRGFEWFSGDYPLHPAPAAEAHDGTSRKRLLAMLGLLARDGDSRELETLMKQDPALSYHLLKLVNSPAFAVSAPIASFGQAITLVGRRQLQRWLQLLLYARQQDDGQANLLLPLAAQRGAQMEALCKQQGGDRAAQDMAFMTGVFSLLDVLLAMPMSEIVGTLSLAPDAARALLTRGGALGTLLRMAEQRAPTRESLQGAGIDSGQWWRSQLHACHWAIQVSRNL